jgi:predicted glycosyltransferase
VTSFLTLGPRLPPEERERIVETRDGAVRGPRGFVRRRPDRYLGSADVVVTMGRYSTVVEALRLGTRVLFVPRAGWDREQAFRAERLVALGLEQLVRPDALTPSGLAAAIRGTLATMPTPLPINFSGLATVGELLAGALA